MEKAEANFFIGTWRPKDLKGQSLGKIFNVFAAPQDLTDESGQKQTYTYKEVVIRLAQLKDWNGYDGTHYAGDKELYKALKEGSYNGGWIIPPRELLAGTDADGNKIHPDNLYTHKDTKTLKDSFCKNTADGYGFPDWYWSSTEHRSDPTHVWNVHFTDGTENNDSKEWYRLSCRPVRLVEVRQS